MAFFRVLLTGVYSEQQIVNTFYYLGTGIPAAVTMSFGLFHAFGRYDSGFPIGTPLRVFMENLSDEFQLLNITVEDIVSPTDFFTTPYPSTAKGSLTGEAMSPSAAYGFISAKTRRDIDASTKRFVGVVEDYVGSKGYIVNTFLTGNLGNMASKLGETLTYDDEGSILTYRPITIKRQRYDTPSGRKAYRIPRDPVYLEANHAFADTWSPYPTVRTQVSRQYGHGR